MEWLIQQAQSASPFIAVCCLLGAGILWRQHIKDQATILSLADANNKTATASAAALASATTALQGVQQQLIAFGKRR